MALTAGAGDGPGIVVICGTGSICYGRNEQGQAARSGGWGYILGDEGSGYWIGRRALAAVVRHADGRGPATTLAARVLQHFRVRGVPDLVQEVHLRDPRRHRVASIAEAVQAACDEGDVVARDIVERACDELVNAAGSVAERLSMRGLVFPLVLAGGRPARLCRRCASSCWPGCPTWPRAACRDCSPRNPPSARCVSPSRGPWGRSPAAIRLSRVHMPNTRLSSSMQIRVFADERAVADALAVMVAAAVAR